MRSIIFIIMLCIMTSFCCVSKSYSDGWPDISFVVLDEIPDKFVFERPRNVSPTVNRVLVLPIVDNYHWNGKLYNIALADPIVVQPGKETIRKMFSFLTKDKQRVRKGIVLARGHCPGTLKPVFNYAGEYNGKTVWLIELAKLSEKQYKMAYQSIIRELSQSSLTIGKEKNFEEAVKEKKLISTGELLSPIVRDSEGYRNTIVLWNVKAGTDIPVCLSKKGMETLKAELGGE